MPKLIQLKTHTSENGNLTVIERCLPFKIKRVFYLTHVKGSRGNHGHKITLLALICLVGSVEIMINDHRYLLDREDKCLIVYPKEKHIMTHFSKNAILLALASEEYDPHDFIE